MNYSHISKLLRLSPRDRAWANPFPQELGAQPGYNNVVFTRSRHASSTFQDNYLYTEGMVVLNSSWAHSWSERGCKGRGWLALYQSVIPKSGPRRGSATFNPLSSNCLSLFRCQAIRGRCWRWCGHLRRLPTFRSSQVFEADNGLGSYLTYSHQYFTGRGAFLRPLSYRAYKSH